TAPPRNKGIVVGGVPVTPGQRRIIDLPAPALTTREDFHLPVVVIHGRRQGPRLCISSAIHGDEINGVEIIRRLLTRPALNRLRGTLIAVPVVNIYGFLNRSRYLPDRRDLNRSFPGSDKGSIAARLARLYVDEVLAASTHAIDLHTAAIHRENLPHIRANMDHPETARLAAAFGAPVTINGDTLAGSLREAAAELRIPLLLYEAGEALRFNETAIRAGVRGILSVMRALEMLPSRGTRPGIAPLVPHSTQWIRAPEGGVLRHLAPLGKRIEQDDVLGFISDPFGEMEVPVLAPASGIVIGRTTIPLVNEGDALLHLGRFDRPSEAERAVEAFQAAHAPDSDPARLPTDPPVL
ncbi:MAG: succinylglutamate desuccinylase/aspartoacylase family protein, partial [Pseudomonadota bacterium]|nr:succinylglutamate desuccinylase/aspartoacylase family protein [Pseudomonadota bacterium]